MIDMALVGSIKESTGAISSISNQLAVLDICSVDTANAISKTASLMELGANMAQILLASKVAYDSLAARKVAEGTTLTAVNALAGPAGWGKIAFAAGVTAAVSAILIGSVHSLTTQEGRLNAVTNVAVT